MKILFLSDFLPDDRVTIGEKLSALITKADKVIFNLEGSPLANSKKDKAKQIMPFQVDTLLSFLEKIGKEKFIIALANNHILDNGLLGFDYLVDCFKKNGISYFGTTDTPFITIDDKISILNFVTAETVARYSSKKRLNYLFYNSRQINKQILQLEKTNRKLIMYPHWGRDLDRTIFNTYSLKYSKDKWKVFGHHPHVISGISPNWIYSMGNTFIPHPNYYKRFPAVSYGLAVFWNSLEDSYELFQTRVKPAPSNKFEIQTLPFSRLPKEVEEHHNMNSKLKRIFFSTFSFRGNKADWVRLWSLQIISKILDFKRRVTA